MTTIAKSFEDVHKPQDIMPKTVRLGSNFKAEIADRATITKERPRPKETMRINCFTDGSRDGETTGAGYILMSNCLKEQDSIYLGGSHHSCDLPVF